MILKKSLQKFFVQKKMKVKYYAKWKQMRCNGCDNLIKQTNGGSTALQSFRHKKSRPERAALNFTTVMKR